MVQFLFDDNKDNELDDLLNKSACLIASSHRARLFIDTLS